MARQSLSAVISLEAAKGNVKQAFGAVDAAIDSVTRSMKDNRKLQRSIAKDINIFKKQGKDATALESKFKKLNKTLARQERLSKSIAATHRNGSKAIAGMGRAIGGLGAVTKRVGQGIGVALAGGVAAASVQITKLSGQVAELRKEGLSKSQIGTLLPKANEFSKMFNVDPKDIISTFTMFKKAGYDVEQSLSSIPNVLALAKAESMELASSFQVAM